MRKAAIEKLTVNTEGITKVTNSLKIRTAQQLKTIPTITSKQKYYKITIITTAISTVTVYILKERQ